MGSSNSGIPTLDNNPTYLQKFLTYKDNDIIASDVSRFRLIPPSTTTNGKNKYPVDQCKSFMRSVSEAGYGSIEETSRAGTTKKSLTFRKRPFSELGLSQQEGLKTLRITESDYNAEVQLQPTHLCVNQMKAETAIILY